MQMIPAGFRPPRIHEQRFSVSFEYPVAFCKDALSVDDPTLAWAISRREPERLHPVYVVADAGVVHAHPELAVRLERYAGAYSKLIDLVAPLHVVPGGEAVKNDPAIVRELQACFARAKLDRQAIVLVIGGGAVLDAVGYAASTTHRGVRVVRMPTTVLAQNDAGVGVKTGINAFGAKNFAGTFAPPFAVVNDAELLRTLPERDARAGMAEAIKVALIRDNRFFTWLEQTSAELFRCEARAVDELVRRCAELHLQHIAGAGDPFETGSARPLDYGHWSAHKLELLSHHELRHGEAVAIGMALDARYAEQKGMLPRADLERICGLITSVGLPLYHPALTERQGGELAVMRGLQEFREHLGGALTITLLEGIGRSREVCEIDEATMLSAIAWLAERESACAYAS